MVCSVIKDVDFLSQQSTIVKKDSDYKSIIANMIDTANFYKDMEKGCVGLAAVQIGYTKRICIVKNGENKWLVMINPVITKKSKATFMSEEGCLSLNGTRTIKRHITVTVTYLNENFKSHSIQMTAEPAIIVQHEIDHLNGKLV